MAPDERAVRTLWLCADDYGLAPGVDAAIVDLIARGRLNATSAMVVSPNFTAAGAASLLRLNVPRRRVAIGLHLTLSAPFRPRAFAPTQAGGFLPLAPLMARGLVRLLSPPALAAEINAQLSAFIAAFGAPPDFIDGHQHVHLLPQVRAALLDAMAARCPNALVRQCGRGRPLLRLDPKGLLLDRLSLGLTRAAKARGIATNPSFAGTYTYTEAADFAAVFPSFLEYHRDGGLIMCHPGHVDAALVALDPLTQLREREHAFLAGDDFPALLARQRVALALSR